MVVIMLIMAVIVGGAFGLCRIFGNGSIKGSAWVVRNNGESVLLRGEQICLYKDAAVDAEKVRVLCNASLDKAQSEADRDRRIYGKEVGTEEVDRITRLIAEANSALAAIKGRPTVGLYEAYALLESAELANGQHYVSLIDLTAAFKITNVDVDGHYRFDGVPSGKYFLGASFMPSSGHVIWFVPIEVPADKEATFDLFNANSRAFGQ